ncbi:securin [Callorhinchus milii]|uniref:Securin n=1 Tax=Callorhinchus milii TaxID=7868 RepID=V9L6A9_CALMI|nr:securin [Callorhinchus milii]|eukprot:gi/632976495/ref/XP_007904826.1/ PREDICTED: securin-like [Callorhinchus milii]
MAVRIFVEKENDLLSTHKISRPKLLTSSSPIFSERSVPQTPQPNKVLNATPGLKQSARKALGDLNCPVRVSTKANASQKNKTIHKEKNNSSILKAAKPTEMVISDVSHIPIEMSEDYPEMEIFIPYNPLEFENVNVPEEHQLDSACLAGLPLSLLEKEGELINNLLNKITSPMEWPSLPQEFNFLDWDMNPDLSNGLTVELPSMDFEF